jgi:hypothetical protein
MTCQEIIDEVANDRVWLVAEFGHNPADEHARASVPFEVNHAVGFARAVNFRPAMRTARSLMFGRYEFEFPFELRIAHDLVAQRSPSARDYLNHCLHSTLTFNRKSVSLQCLFRTAVVVVAMGDAMRTRLYPLALRIAKRLQKRTKHDVNIDISFFRVPKSAGQSANDLKAEMLPKVNRGGVRRNDKVELHRPKPKPTRLA